MAIAFDSVIQQILDRLGAVKGANATDVTTNFSAAPSASTVNGPDFVPVTVQPALAATIAETVEAIASTPLNPERGRFESDTVLLSNGDAIPRADSGGNVIIGVPGRVRDSADGKTLLEVDVDRVRSFNEFAGSVYGGFDAYWYAKSGDVILHTRSKVIIRVCTFTRPTSFTGNINLDDWHEGGLVAGTVEKLALKESLFADLYAGASKARAAHLAEIRGYGNPELYGRAHSAPSSV